MLCILKMENGELKGWILAADMHDAIYKANGADARDLAAELYRRELEPPRGKHELPGGYVMLVD